jgi:hypothetical protein
MISILTLDDPSVYVLRASDDSFSESLFLKTIEKKLSRTKYKIISKDSDAPESTSCITAIRYLFRQHTQIEIPKVFIGDMPRTLVGLCGWKVLRVKISEMQCGDLLFLRSKPAKDVTLNEQYIVHVAVSIGRSRIFHSSSHRGTGCIEDLRDLNDAYKRSIINGVVEDPSYFLFYIDPRNKKLRDQFGSDIISVDSMVKTTATELVIETSDSSSSSPAESPVYVEPNHLTTRLYCSE